VAGGVVAVAVGPGAVAEFWAVPSAGPPQAARSRVAPRTAAALRTLRR
jgi:hypothetical protein